MKASGRHLGMCASTVTVQKADHSSVKKALFWTPDLSWSTVVNHWLRHGSLADGLDCPGLRG